MCGEKNQQKKGRFWEGVGTRIIETGARVFLTTEDMEFFSQRKRRAADRLQVHTNSEVKRNHRSSSLYFF